MDNGFNFQNGDEEKDTSQSKETTLPILQESPSTTSDNEGTSLPKIVNSIDHDHCLWDLEHSSPLIVVLDQGRTARRLKCRSSTDLVRTRGPLPPGNITVHFNFNHKPWGSHCAVGLVTDAYATKRTESYCHLMGQDENSWCLDIPSRRVMHNGSVRPGYNMPPREEDIQGRISMQVNTVTGKLTFVVNDKVRGLAYSNLRGVDVYPAVAMVYARQTVTITCEVAHDDADSSVDSHSDSVSTPRNGGSQVSLEDTATRAGCGSSMAISDYPARQQLVIQVAHGWDTRRMGEKLCGAMPNAPNVCYPPKPTFSVSFPYRQQAVVARRGFSHGRFVWRIKEEIINHYLMRGGPENMPLKQNDVIIGVSTSRFDRFMDAGIPLRLDFSAEFWGWKVADSCLVFRRRRRSQRFPPALPLKVDLKEGVRVVLDCADRTLSFVFRDQHLGVAFCDLPIDEPLFPTIIFDGHSWYPMRLELLEAPERYIENFITEAETTSIDKDDYLDLIGFATLEEVAKKDDQVEASRVVRRKFGWYLVGLPACVQHKDGYSESVFHTIFVNPAIAPYDANRGTAIFSEFGLSHTGRHVIYFNLSEWRPYDRYRIGFVDSTYVELSEEVRSNAKIQADTAQMSAAFEVMQNHYWAWDMAEQKLFHAGRAICNYPVVGFNASKFKHYQLVVDIRKHVSVSLFAADSQTGDDLDLGVMVTNLSDRRPLFPMVHYLSGYSPISILYMEGPKAYLDEFNRTQSRTCSLL